MVPMLSLGTATFGGSTEFFRAFGSSDVAHASRLVDVCLDAGLNMFDSADVYSGGVAEEILGQAIKGRREEVLISTKATFRAGQGPNDVGSSRYHITRAVDAALKRLSTDRIDLYQLHTPDPSVPIADTLGALNDLVRAGKVSEIGCSNFSAEQLAEAEQAARELGTARFVALQNHYNLLRRDDDADVLPLCRKLNVSYVPFFPLASALLTGKLRRGEAPPEGSRLVGREVDGATWNRVEALAAFAEAHGRTLLELAISALASTPA